MNWVVEGGVEGGWEGKVRMVNRNWESTGKEFQDRCRGQLDPYSLSPTPGSLKVVEMKYVVCYVWCLEVLFFKPRKGWLGMKKLKNKIVCLGRCSA